jgi:hypothetical protein
LLARFFADAFLARFFAGALLARFFAGALLARFFAGALLARFFVGCFVAMASPEAVTLSESLRLATSTWGVSPRPRRRIRNVPDALALARWRNDADFLVPHRFEHADHENIPRRNTGEQVL